MAHYTQFAFCIIVDIAPLPCPKFIKNEQKGKKTMCKIIGIERVNYTNKNTGRAIDGYRIHVTYEKTSVNGLATDSFYVNAETFFNYFDLRLGSEIEVYYNKYGNACGCTVLERSN